MNSHEEQRFKPIDPPPPDPIRLIPTEKLFEEVKRRSIGCMLVAMLVEDNGLVRWLVESKGSGDVLKDVMLQVSLEETQRKIYMKEN